MTETVNDSAFIQAHQKAEVFSRYIEVLLHASESPLTDNDLKKHLMMSNSERTAALAVLQQRLSSGVLTFNSLMCNSCKGVCVPTALRNWRATFAVSTTK